MANNIEFTLGAKSDTAAAVNQAVADVRRYEAELKKLNETAKSGSVTQEQLQAATANVAKAQANLRDAVRSSAKEHEQFAGALKQAADGMASQAGAAAPLLRTLTGMSLVAGLAAAAMTAFAVVSIGAATSIGNYQEAVEKAADSTGLTEREIGGLKVAAANVGRTFQDIAPGLNIFSRHMGEARSGSDQAAQAFAKVGVSLTDLNTLSTGDILEKVARDLEATGNAADRNAKLFALFGRGGAEQLAILRQSMKDTQEEADRLGINLTDAQKAVAKEADQAADQFKVAWEGALNKIQAKLAPIGTTLLKLANAAMGANNEEDFYGGGGRQPFPFATQTVPDRPFTRSGYNVPIGPALEDYNAAKSRATAAAQLAEEQFEKSAQAALKALEDQANAIERRFELGGIKTTDELLRQLEALRDQATTLKQQEEIAKRIAAIYKANRDLIPGPQPGPGGLQPRLGPGSVTTPQPINPQSRRQQDPGFVDPLALSDQQKQLESDLAGLVSTLRDDLAGALTNAILGVGDLDEAFQQMFNDLLGGLIKTGIHALIPLPFAHGGTLGIPHAQSGLMVSGIRGSDSTIVAMQQGETIVSTRDTERWSRFLDSWEASMRGQSSGSGGGGGGRAVTINAPITIHEAAPRGRKLEDWTRDELMRVLRQVAQTGAFR